MAAGRFGKNDKVDVLAKLPLFARCSRRELGRIADICVEEEKKAGSVLTHEGQAGGVAFVIVEGDAEVRQGRRVLGSVGPGEVIGELALIDGRPRSASVHATTDLRVLEISSDDFSTLLDDMPHFTRNLLVSLSLRIRQMDEHWKAEL
ncbi:MAG TPA: cyclic nucleotide-binding domain-containing protein [Acidimicrobiales bacterium]|nr:cyclic nucleotide-binding domain-containing protein [Acidimicrobiales bacterium]